MDYLDNANGWHAIGTGNNGEQLFPLNGKVY